MIKKSEKPQFTDEQIKLCYHAFREGKKRDEVMKLMGFGITELNECYFLGFQKFSNHAGFKAIAKLKVDLYPVLIDNKPKKLVRVKCMVSNTSPYKIARPGLGN
jgi:hypothetical protein